VSPPHSTDFVVSESLSDVEMSRPEREFISSFLVSLLGFNARNAPASWNLLKAEIDHASIVGLLFVIRSSKRQQIMSQHAPISATVRGNC
jgi:hypothetical protein